MCRKAVIIWGYSNSGKTTTIKHFLNVRRRLYNRVYNITNNDRKLVEIFVEGQSPSEKDETLEDLIKIYNKGILPKNIIVAEQIDGKNAGNTVDYLIKNRYKITFFIIQNPAKFNKDHWDYNPNTTIPILDLDKRAEDIKAIFKSS